MTKMVTTETYYNLYNAIRERPRFTLKQLAPILGIGGRGQKFSTVTSRISKMYKKRISLKPNLVLKTYDNCFTKAYFLKVKNSEGISKAFHSLRQNLKLSYLLFLSGRYDFFVTSRFDLDFEEDIKIMKKEICYTPIFSVPAAWNQEVKDALMKITEIEFLKGKLERKMEEWLPWEDIHFRIFEIMRNDIQMPFKKVSTKTEFTECTVRDYFWKDIIPYCEVSHYFFPKGYDYYQKAFIIFHSDFEKGIIEAFSRMPCTVYFYPFENELALNIFYENLSDLMICIRKVEEKGYIKKYLLHIPLFYSSI